MPKNIGSFAAKVVTLMLFGAASFVTLFFAYGYQYDLKNRDVRKTSIIDLPVKISHLQVFLDGVLQFDALPYQIKNLLPGKYLVSVRKDGFIPWQRAVEVKEDIVSVVNDVFLVPENVQDTVKFLKQLGGSGRYVFGKNRLYAFQQDTQSLGITSLFDNGTTKDEDFQLYRSGIDSVQTLSDESLLLKFTDGVYAWIDLPDRNFKFFTLPKDIESIQINNDNQTLYYVKGGLLSRAPLYLLGLQKSVTVPSFKVRDDVQAYAMGFSGQIYFLSSGMLYRSGEEGRDVRLIDQNAGNYVNLSFTRGREYGTLIVRDRKGARTLYLADRNGTLQAMEDRLKGQSFLNGFDQLVYANVAGDIFYYDPNTFEKSLVTNVKGDFDLLGWFTDQGHFLLSHNNNVVMKDVFDANEYTLLENVQDKHFFVLDKTMFYLDADKKLYSLNWENSLLN